MAQPEWEPTKRGIPSPKNLGDPDTEVINLAVGWSLSRWEHLEMGLTRLFQVLCETKSFAACRAYGSLDSSYARAGMLRAAADVFFGNRSAADGQQHKEIKKLFAAYENSFKYRNNIAHGIACGYHLKEGPFSGYFLCPPSYSTKKVDSINPREIYLLGASYWYTAEDVQHYGKRFESLLAETMRLIQEVNNKYKVLENSELHP